MNSLVPKQCSHGIAWTDTCEKCGRHVPEPPREPEVNWLDHKRLQRELVDAKDAKDMLQKKYENFFSLVSNPWKLFDLKLGPMPKVFTKIKNKLIMLGAVTKLINRATYCPGCGANAHFPPDKCKGCPFRAHMEPVWADLRKIMDAEQAANNKGHVIDLPYEMWTGEAGVTVSPVTALTKHFVSAGHVPYNGPILYACKSESLTGDKINPTLHGSMLTSGIKAGDMVACIEGPHAGIYGYPAAYGTLLKLGDTLTTAMMTTISGVKLVGVEPHEYKQFTGLLPKPPLGDSPIHAAYSDILAGELLTKEQKDAALKVLMGGEEAGKGKDFTVKVKIDGESIYQKLKKLSAGYKINAWPLSKASAHKAGFAVDFDKSAFQLLNAQADDYTLNLDPKSPEGKLYHVNADLAGGDVFGVLDQLGEDPTKHYKLSILDVEYAYNEQKYCLFLKATPKNKDVVYLKLDSHSIPSLGIEPWHDYAHLNLPVLQETLWVTADFVEDCMGYPTQASAFGQAITLTITKSDFSKKPVFAVAWDEHAKAIKDMEDKHFLAQLGQSYPDDLLAMKAKAGGLLHPDEFKHLFVSHLKKIEKADAPPMHPNCGSILIPPGGITLPYYGDDIEGKKPYNDSS